MFLPGQAALHGEHAAGSWDGGTLRIEFVGIVLNVIPKCNP